MEWDETTPSDLIKVNDEDNSGENAGDKVLRELKVDLNARIGLEHNFALGTRPYHKAGLSSVVYIGTTLEINNLFNIPKGSIVYDTTLKSFKVYDGTSWVLRTGDHSILSNLGIDSHTQYLHLSKTGQSLSQNLSVSTGKKVDGRTLGVDRLRIKAFFEIDTGKIALTFADSNEIRRNDGRSFVDDGFTAGDTIITTSTYYSNNGPFTIVTVTDTYLIVTIEGVAVSVLYEITTAAILKLRRGFGAWETATFANGTVYGPELNDCFITFNTYAAEYKYDEVYTNYYYTRTYIYCYVGTTSSPSRILYSYLPDWSSSNRTPANYVSWTFPVRKSQYWRIYAVRRGYKYISMDDDAEWTSTYIAYTSAMNIARMQVYL